MTLQKWNKIFESEEYFLELIATDLPDVDIITAKKFVSLIITNYYYQFWKENEFERFMLKTLDEIYQKIDPIKQNWPKIKDKYEDLTTTITSNLTTDGNRQDCQPELEEKDIKKYVVSILNQTANYGENSVKTETMNRNLVDDIKKMIELPHVNKILDMAVLTLQPYVYEKTDVCNCGFCAKCREQKFDTNKPYYKDLKRQLIELCRRMGEFERKKAGPRGPAGMDGKDGINADQYLVQMPLKWNDILRTPELQLLLDNSKDISFDVSDIGLTGEIKQSILETFILTYEFSDLITSAQTIIDSINELVLEKPNFEDLEILSGSIEVLNDVVATMTTNIENLTFNKVNGLEAQNGEIIIDFNNQYFYADVLGISPQLKTINGFDIKGSGNIEIDGSGGTIELKTINDETLFGNGNINLNNYYYTKAEIEMSNQLITDAIFQLNDVKADKTYVDNQLSNKQDFLGSSSQHRINLSGASPTILHTDEYNQHLASIYQMKNDDALKTDDKTVVGAINELNDKLNNLTYQKYVDVDVNTNQYTFNNFDNNYWHNFVVEYTAQNNTTYSGTLERMPNIALDIVDCNVGNDFSASSSATITFDSSNKLLQVLNWGQNPYEIKHVTIYRKPA